jgi:small-conductance mechanosensitive channel
MTGKIFRRALFIVLMLGAVVGVIGTVLVRYWISPPEAPRVSKAKTSKAELVDQQPLITAQHLAALATSPEEQDFAQNALRVADHEVDMAFAAALHNATEHTPPIPATARPILARVQKLQARVQQEEAQAARLKQSLAKADDAHKEALEAEQQLQAATLEVDQESLELARQELIQAGGDPRSKIQELLDQHESVGHNKVSVNAAQVLTETQSNQSRILLVQFRAWRLQVEKEKELESARAELGVREVQLAREYQSLDKETKEDREKETAGQPESASPSPAASASPDISSLKEAAGERKHLAELHKRTADLQQLDTIYGQWAALIKDRELQHRSSLLEGCGWILALLLLVLFADPLVRGMVARAAPESRRRHTVHMIGRFVAQAGGVALILLVLFGPPSQLATVLALTGAGLTVALKDFIVGFFGWFILMGPNGIHPGDWVEINGIGGEVVSVGLLHTVILETGNWSDAGHPTGRKVTFVNSFAIEGHYFNFSTTGQWLWDELEVPIPAGVDPYPIAEAVHKAVTEATESDIRTADQEWQRVVPGHVGRTFSPVPAMTVRPTTLGVSVVVRYITRAHQRHEVRTRLFQQVVDLLRAKQVSTATLESPSSKAATAAG